MQYTRRSTMLETVPADRLEPLPRRRRVLTVCDVAADGLALEVELHVEQLALQRAHTVTPYCATVTGQQGRQATRRELTNRLALWLSAVAALPKASSSVPAAVSAPPAPPAPPASTQHCRHTRAASVLPAPLSPATTNRQRSSATRPEKHSSRLGATARIGNKRSPAALTRDDDALALAPVAHPAVRRRRHRVPATSTRVRSSGRRRGAQRRRGGGGRLTRAAAACTAAASGTRAPAPPSRAAARGTGSPTPGRCPPTSATHRHSRMDPGRDDQSPNPNHRAPAFLIKPSHINNNLLFLRNYCGHVILLSINIIQFFIHTTTITIHVYKIKTAAFK